MNTDTNMPDMDASIPENAVSVYGQDGGLDDFPVLKAFQQYIDAEQAKARKRLLMLCSFFGFLMIVVIAVFLVMLMNISSRNQTLNDRLVEFAMRDRDRPGNGSAVVVQPQQDSAAILALTAKMDEMQKKLAADQAKAEKAVADAKQQVEAAEKKAAEQKAALEAATKGPTPEEVEIQKLKALLKAEKEKNSAEAEKRRQEELEAYRRKHYPELYEQPKSPSRKSTASNSSRKVRQSPVQLTDEDREIIDDILNDDNAVSYFDEEDDEDDEPVVRRRSTKKTRKASEQKSPSREEAAPVKKDYSIPVDVKGSSSSWLIPNE